MNRCIVFLRDLSLVSNVLKFYRPMCVCACVVLCCVLCWFLFLVCVCVCVCVGLCCLRSCVCGSGFFVCCHWPQTKSLSRTLPSIQIFSKSNTHLWSIHRLSSRRKCPWRNIPKWMNGWPVLRVRCAPRWRQCWRKLWKMCNSSVQKASMHRSTCNGWTPTM